jgi:hypothetical protein
MDKFHFLPSSRYLNLINTNSTKQLAHETNFQNDFQNDLQNDLENNLLLSKLTSNNIYQQFHQQKYKHNKQMTCKKIVNLVICMTTAIIFVVFILFIYYGKIFNTS